MVLERALGTHRTRLMFLKCCTTAVKKSHNWFSEMDESYSVACLVAIGDVSVLLTYWFMSMHFIVDLVILKLLSINHSLSRVKTIQIQICA